MWWKKLTAFVMNDLFPETNGLARVVYETPQVEALDGAHLECRVTRRGDGFTMISLLIQHPGGTEENPRRYAINFLPEVSEAIKASVDSCLAEYERLKTEPKY